MPSLAAGRLEALGGEAAAAVGQHVRDPEGEGGERLRQEGPSTRLGLGVLDRQVDEARAAIDGHEQVALAPLAIGGAQLRQVLHVQVHEAEIVLLEGPRRLARAARGREPPQARGPEDPVDRVPVQMRQEVGDHEGEVVEREAGRAAQGAHDRPLLLAGLPGQLVRPAGAVPAIGGPALAPLADGLGADAEAPGQLAGGLGGARRSRRARPGWCGRWGGSRASGRSSRLQAPARGPQSAKRTPRSPNAPDPNNVPPPNT